MVCEISILRKIMEVYMRITYKRIAIALVLVGIVIVLILTISNFGDSLGDTINQMG